MDDIITAIAIAKYKIRLAYDVYQYEPPEVQGKDDVLPVQSTVLGAKMRKKLCLPKPPFGRNVRLWRTRWRNSTNTRSTLFAAWDKAFRAAFYVTLKNNTSDRTIMIDVKEKVFSCIANGIVRMLSNAELFIMKQVKNGDGIF